MNTLLERLRWRYAVKRYDRSRKLTTEDLASLESAIRLSPSSFGIQPYKILVITDPQVRERLRAASHDQSQITDASHLFVFAIIRRVDVRDIDEHFALLCRERNLVLEGEFLRHRNSVVESIQRMSEERKAAWATHQAYLALGGMLFTAAQLGIDANPMEGFVASRYDEELQLEKQGLSAVVIAGAGYRADDDRFQKFKKVRKPDSELFIRIGD